MSLRTAHRLLATVPDIQREDDVIAEHINSIKPTVLISPSFQHCDGTTT